MENRNTHKTKSFISIITIFLCAMTLTNIVSAQSEKPQEDYGYIVQAGQEAPDFSTITVNGDTIHLSDLKGKVIMLQFTASWCGVCRREMPHIESEIWQKHRNNPNFFLLGIDLDEPKEKVKEFAKDIPVTYPMALDPNGEIFYSYAEEGAGVTRNVIIDQTGRIVFLTRLYKEEEFEKMKTVIETLLQSSPKAKSRTPR